MDDACPHEKGLKPAAAFCEPGSPFAEHMPYVELASPTSVLKLPLQSDTGPLSPVSPTLATLPCDALVRIFESLHDVLTPYAAADLCASCKHVNESPELQKLLWELREDHRRACALAVRCGDWDARFRRVAPYSSGASFDGTVAWVSIGLVASDCHVLGSMCRSANLCTSLTVLNLRDNGITSAGLRALLAGFVFTTALVELHLGQNALGAEGIEVLAESLTPMVLPRLHNLQLWDNGLSRRKGEVLPAELALAARLAEGCLPELTKRAREQWRTSLLARGLHDKLALYATIATRLALYKTL